MKVEVLKQFSKDWVPLYHSIFSKKFRKLRNALENFLLMYIQRQSLGLRNADSEDQWESIIYGAVLFSLALKLYLGVFQHLIKARLARIRV